MQSSEELKRSRSRQRKTMFINFDLGSNNENEK